MIELIKNGNFVFASLNLDVPLFDLSKDQSNKTNALWKFLNLKKAKTCDKEIQCNLELSTYNNNIMTNDYDRAIPGINVDSTS